MKDFKAENDLFKLRRVLDMFDAMVKIEFETESVQEFKNTLQASVKDIIKPEMVKLGNNLKFNQNTK